MATLQEIYNNLPSESLGKLYILNNDKNYFDIKEFNKIFIKSLNSNDLNNQDYLLNLYVKYIDEVFENYLNWAFRHKKQLNYRLKSL